MRGPETKKMQAFVHVFYMLYIKKHNLILKLS